MNTYHSMRWSAVRDQPLLGPRFTMPRKLSWDEPASEVLDTFSEQSMLNMKADMELSKAREVFDKVPQLYACISDTTHNLNGILAKRDLYSRQAVQTARELQVPFAEVPVHYLMQPVSELPLIGLRQLQHARIGDAVATLQKSGKDYLLVHDNNETVGLISALGIAALTGESVHVSHHASTFFEILHAVKHPAEVS